MAQASDRQPELLVPNAAADPDQLRERLRLGAPFDRRDLLDHQRDRERREHVEMLIEVFEHRPYRDEFGDDADDGAAGERQQEACPDRQAEFQHEHRAEHAAEHGELARGEAHHPRGREHGVVGDTDERVDRARGQSGSDESKRAWTARLARFLSVSRRQGEGAVLRRARLRHHDFLGQIAVMLRRRPAVIAEIARIFALPIEEGDDARAIGGARGFDRPGESARRRRCRRRPTTAACRRA